MDTFRLVNYYATFLLTLMHYLNYVQSCQFNNVPDIGDIEFSISGITLLQQPVLVPTVKTVVTSKLRPKLFSAVEFVPLKEEMISELKSFMIYKMCVGVGIKVRPPKPTVDSVLIFKMCLGSGLPVKLVAPEVETDPEVNSLTVYNV